MEEEKLIIHTDGGSRGNPGPAACAFVANLSEKYVEEQSEYLGITTNNVAEYRGVLLAANWLLKNSSSMSIKKVYFYLDSELVVKQFLGEYKIKKSELLELNVQIKNILNRIGKEFTFVSIPRELNKIADALVNKELDSL